jgi:hypothetical protein
VVKTNPVSKFKQPAVETTGIDRESGRRSNFCPGNSTPEAMADPWSTQAELPYTLAVYVLCMVTIERFNM